MASVGGVVQKLFGEYDSKTPKRLKIIDAYLTYILLTGIVQFAYCCLVGTFPFNSFLSGFISSVASFVLAGQSQLTIDSQAAFEFRNIMRNC
jgi:oligosaccharyltransferase complex subunit epsilon